MKLFKGSARGSRADALRSRSTRPGSRRTPRATDSGRRWRRDSSTSGGCPCGRGPRSMPPRPRRPRGRGSPLPSCHAHRNFAVGEAPSPAVVRSHSRRGDSSIRCPSTGRSLAHDLAGSIAHAEMLGRTGILTAEEVRPSWTVFARSVGRSPPVRSRGGPSSRTSTRTSKSRLTEMVGPSAASCTRREAATTRSRSTSGSTCGRRRGDHCACSSGSNGGSLAKAAAEAATPMPGYTHLQRAQSVTVGHYLLAHFWRFDRDIDRLLATAERASVSPLGAGALAGSTLPIDPHYVAARLGFSRAFENSLDAVSDRDPAGRTRVRPRPRARPCERTRGGDRAVRFEGVRIPAPNPRARLREQPDAPEAQPRRRRTGPWKERPRRSAIWSRS